MAPPTTTAPTGAAPTTTSVSAARTDEVVRLDLPPRPTLLLLHAAATHIGHHRDGNEDAHLADGDRRLFAVADGIGGRPFGEVASALTIATVDAELAADTLTAGPRCEGLRGALDRANELVVADAEAQEERRGMGTTVVVAHVADDGTISLAHAGDSRAYLLRAGHLAQLTIDHVRMRKGRRLLHRCVGRRRGVHADVLELVGEPGDRLLLCTDGLTDLVSDEDIRSLLRAAGSPEQAADGLVAAALEAGGRDNVTVVVVHLEAPPAADVAPGGGVGDARAPATSAGGATDAGRDGQLDVQPDGQPGGS